MTRTLLRTVGVFVVALALVVGTAAAMGAGASDRATESGEEAIGPPGDLPDPVPEFVSTVLDTIREFLAGTVGEAPGGEVSDAAGDGDGRAGGGSGSEGGG